MCLVQCTIIVLPLIICSSFSTTSSSQSSHVISSHLISSHPLYPLPVHHSLPFHRLVIVSPRMTHIYIEIAYKNICFYYIHNHYGTDKLRSRFEVKFAMDWGRQFSTLALDLVSVFESRQHTMEKSIHFRELSHFYELLGQ